MTDRPDQLPCGARLEELVAQVADNAPPADEAHQASCPYCHSALRHLHRSWADVTELAQEPVSVPRGLTAQIMVRVKTLAAQAADFILLGHPRGETRVSHSVVGRIGRQAASTVPGVIFATARVQSHNPAQPDRLNLSIQLIVSFGPALQRLADLVRQNVRRQTFRLTGARTARIDITIDDVTTPRA